MINAIVFKNNPQHGLFLESLEKNAPGVFKVSEIHDSENFKQELLGLISSDYEYTAFFTEGDILFNVINESEIIDTLSDEEVLCFSLRLGENTTHCNALNMVNNLYDQEVAGNIIKWEWSKHYLDFGCPLSLDGHIFRTKEIYKLVKNIPFKNSDSLEEGLQAYEFLPREKMAAFKNSVLVGANVQTLDHPVLEELDFSNINSVQQTIKRK